MNSTERISQKNVWIFVALILLVSDLGLRLFETSVSANARELADFELRAHALKDFSRPSVIFVGNSLFGNALARDRLKNDPRFDEKGTDVFVADASNIYEWYCIIDDVLNDALKPGDTMLIGFAWDQVADQTVLDMSRTFGRLCPARFLRIFSALGHPVGVGRWMELGLIKASKIYTYREALRNKILSFVIPDYQSQIQLLNQSAKGEKSSSESADYSFHIMRSLADKLAARRIELSIVAMPVVESYEITPELCEALAGSGAQVFDLRKIDRIGDDDFRDPIHLNERGARVFTERIISMLTAEPRNNNPFCGSRQ